jgi:hypothetical protein
MPKKLNFERDLININITRKAYEKIMKRRMENEPVYRIVDRIVFSYLDGSIGSDWEYMYHDSVETLKKVRQNLKEKDEALQKIIQYGAQLTFD